LVVSGQTKTGSKIYDPTGKILAETKSIGTNDSYATASINPKTRFLVATYWQNGASLGERRSVYMEERRPDTYQLLFGK
jgi:hypothetical protein